MPNIIDMVARQPSFATLVKPVPRTSSGVKEPEHSEIRKVANDVLGAVKYSFTNVAANMEKVKADDSSLEGAFKSALQARKDQANVKKINKIAIDLVKMPSAQRQLVFGRAGKMDGKTFLKRNRGFANYALDMPPLKLDAKLFGVRVPRVSFDPARINDGNLLSLGELDTNRLTERVHRAMGSGVVNREHLRDISGSMTTHDLFVEGDQFDDNFEEFAVTNKMAFYINRVKCVDETNPEWWGSDEIALAGISIDETGDTKKINERYIGGGFDDGDSKSYNPDWRYHWFSLNEGRSWPKTYSMSLVLAEKDHGGLSQALDTLWKKVKEQVYKLIKQAATAAGVAIGAFLGMAEAGAVIGQLLGEAVAWIIDRFLRWIIDLFKDDIFPIATVKVTTPSKSARWYYPNGRWGNPRSNTRRAHFYGYGGHYYVEYYWKFLA